MVTQSSLGQGEVRRCQAYGLCRALSLGGRCFNRQSPLGDSPDALAILRQGVLWSGRAVRRDPPEISMEGLLAVHLFVDRNELRSTHQNNIVADESAVFDCVDLDVEPDRDSPQDVLGLRQNKMVSNLRGAGLIVC